MHISKNIKPNFQIVYEWDISFPLDEKTTISYVFSEKCECMAAIVRLYSDSEARFILRGKIESDKDLINVLFAAEVVSIKMGCTTLYSQEKISSSWLNSVRIFLHCGFKVSDETNVFKGRFDLFEERINRIQNIYSQRKIIPPSAKVSNLSEGIDEARSLLNQTLMMDDFEFDHMLSNNSTSQISKIYSQIVWNNEKIVGVLLVSKMHEAGVFYIPIRYVVPDAKNKWVNSLLMFESVKYGIESGAKFVMFEANTITQKETFHLAIKTGCQNVGSFNRFIKKLTKT